MKGVLTLFIVVLVSLGIVYAHEDNFNEGKELIKSKISCDKLNEEQMEEIGEYLMEQMHPSESHEKMHEVMGFEEEDEKEEKFHINMAKSMYCGEEGMMSGGMMNMMGGNMMNPGMMNVQENKSDYHELITNIGIIVIIIMMAFLLKSKKV